MAMPARDTLSRPPELRELRERGPLSLFLDFDGTLVDLAPTPDGISVPDGLVGRLNALAAALDGRLALVSGRGIADIEKHTGPLSLARAGSHGSDCRHADGASLGAAPQGLGADALADIASFAEKAGFSREDKPHGAALHYRHDPSLEQAGLDFAGGFAARHGLVAKRGKCVIEFVVPGADKGSAVRAFMETTVFSGSKPVFIGDDVTDEDGIAAASEAGGFGIVIGDRTPTAARYKLADPATLHQWLGL